MSSKYRTTIKTSDGNELSFRDAEVDVSRVCGHYVWSGTPDELGVLLEQPAKPERVLEWCVDNYGELFAYHSGIGTYHINQLGGRWQAQFAGLTTTNCVGTLYACQDACEEHVRQNAANNG